MPTSSSPNSVVQQASVNCRPVSLINGTTTVNLLLLRRTHLDDRLNQVDMRFAKILRFGSTRADVGVDLYNLFNTNDTTTFDANFVYATSGATWCSRWRSAAARSRGST